MIANLFDEAIGIEEILLGLSRKSNDNISGKRDIRARKSQFVDDLKIALARIAAIHFMKDCVGS